MRCTRQTTLLVWLSHDSDLFELVTNISLTLRVTTAIRHNSMQFKYTNNSNNNLVLHPFLQDNPGETIHLKQLR